MPTQIHIFRIRVDRLLKKFFDFKELGWAGGGGEGAPLFFGVFEISPKNVLEPKSTGNFAEAKCDEGNGDGFSRPVN